jgi:S1-C subfamily serine protease
MKSIQTFLTVIVSMAVGAMIVGGVTWALDDDDGGGAPRAAVEQPAGDVGDGGSSPAIADSGDFSALYERVRPSVVRITTGDASDNPFDNQADGLGSGVVIDADGSILTNYHVVQGFDEVTVTFSDGTVATGEVAGTDPGNDIALVKVDADIDALRPAALGDSSAVDVGSLVAAIGSPFGLDGTFTTGVISGLDRSLPSSANGRPIRGLLQTDTAVNPGNSGGALFNLAGEVIGINTAIENPTGNGFAGIAYAVPINTPKRFLSQLVAGDTVEHPRLGISGRELTPATADALGVEYGIAVLSVDNGSGADDAGLVGATSGSGDVIIAIDGQPMRSFNDLADYIDSKSIGDEVTLTVQRDGEQIDLVAELRGWDSSA